MCKRSTSDPLVRTFLDRYNLNLLPLPRAGIECGDLFRRSPNGRVSAEFALKGVVDPELPPTEVNRDEPLGALEGELSHSRDLDFGLDLLGGFLAALGAPGILTKVGAQYKQSKTRSLAFEFRDATRDSIDAGELGNALIERHLRKNNPVIVKGSRYFVVTAVARSSSLSVEASGSDDAGGGLEVEALQAATAKAGVSVKRESDTKVTYSGQPKLVFGVELYELFFDEGENAFRLLTPDGPLYTRGAAPPKLEPAFIGEEDEAFVQLEAAA